MRNLFFALVILLIVVSAGFGGALAGGALMYRSMSNAQTSPIAVLPTLEVTAPTPLATAVIQISTTEFETSITKAVEKIGPAVVTVLATMPGQTTFFGPTGDQQSSGSGVIISKEGYILTNNHVVEEAKSVAVVLADGKQVNAKVVGTEIYADLAVLQMEGPVPGQAALGNSDVLKPGQTVIAIGSPLGDFKNTVTVGVVSATGRVIDTGKGYSIEGLIQTDAAINQGNSGGPLLNLAGEVVGINSMVVRGQGLSQTVAEGLGFAIPSNTAKAVAEQIIQKGYFSRPFIGIRWQPISPEIASAYNLPVEWGIYVTGITSDSPAEKAGLKQGDIITQIGEIKIDAQHSFINALFSFKPGEEIVLELMRDKEAIQVRVTLGESNQ